MVDLVDIAAFDGFAHEIFILVDLLERAVRILPASPVFMS